MAWQAHRILELGAVGRSELLLRGAVKKKKFGISRHLHATNDSSLQWYVACTRYHPGVQYAPLVQANSPAPFVFVLPKVHSCNICFWGAQVSIPSTANFQAEKQQVKSMPGDLVAAQPPDSPSLHSRSSRQAAPSPHRIVLEDRRTPASVSDCTFPVNPASTHK